MQLRVTRAVLAAPLALALIVGCCVLTATGSAAGATPRSGPKVGGTLTFGEYSGVTSLDPAKIPGGGVAGGDEAAAIYGTLMRLDTTTNKFVPYMAKGITHNAGYTVWTLSLRPRMRFSDGTPFNAQAVVTNFNRDLNPALHSTAAGLLSGFIGSVNAQGPLTVVFHLKSAWAGFPYALAWTAGFIAAPSYLAKVDGGDTTATPIGAGPFKVASFRPLEELDLVPNTTYFGHRPYLNNLKFVLIPGGTATVQALQGGQLNAAILYDPPAVQQALSDHFPGLPSLFDVASNILLNNRSGSPLANPKLREALNLAISPSIFNQRVYQGAGSSTNQLFPKKSRWYQASAKGIAYDPAKAKQLVAQVKASTGWNGTIRFLCGNEPTRANIPTALEAMLAPVGIQLQVTNDIPTSQVILQVLVQKNFDMACWGYNVVDAAPFPTLWLQLDSASPNNFAGYSSTAMDAALKKLQVAVSAQQTKTALAKVVGVWNRTYPSVNLGQINEMVVHARNVHGLRNSLTAITLFDQAWLS